MRRLKCGNPTLSALSQVVTLPLHIRLISLMKRNCELDELIEHFTFTVNLLEQKVRRRTIDAVPSEPIKAARSGR